MPESTAQRTLVKSPPELWAEVSDAAALAKHLGEFGEIRITRLEPETTVAWEGDRASGTVKLEPSGWGTKVTLTAELVEPEPEPEPAMPEPVAVEPEPRARARARARAGRSRAGAGARARARARRRQPPAAAGQEARILRAPVRRAQARPAAGAARAESRSTCTGAGASPSPRRAPPPRPAGPPDARARSRSPSRSGPQSRIRPCLLRPRPSTAMTEERPSRC